MLQKGTVLKTKGRKAQVEVCSRDACKNCSGCLGGQREHTLWAANPLGAQEGEEVWVELSSGLLLGGAALLYLLPLVLLLLGYAAGASLFQTQAAALGCAALGFVIAIFIGSFCNRQLERRGRLEPVIKKVERKR